MTNESRNTTKKSLKITRDCNLQVQKIARLLYADATTYLPRKRDKISHLL